MRYAASVTTGRSLFAALGAAVLAATFAGCGGGGGSTPAPPANPLSTTVFQATPQPASPAPSATPQPASPAPSATPQAVCMTIEIPVPWTMTSPAPGSTGVPTTIGSVVVPADGLAKAKAVLTLIGPGGFAVVGGTFQAGANGTESASLPVLAPNTTYKVTAPGNFCMPPSGDPLNDWILGSFTTGS
jgi:hypothetical protein